MQFNAMWSYFKADGLFVNNFCGWKYLMYKSTTIQIKRIEQYRFSVLKFIFYYFALNLGPLIQWWKNSEKKKLNGFLFGN